jgi:hypothetical protein
LATVTITGTPQAGKSTVTVSGTGYTAGQVLSVLMADPEYGSNWATPDGTSVTAARTERVVKCDNAGVFSFPAMLSFAATYTITTRPITEQYLTTSASATTTVTPSQPNT